MLAASPIVDVGVGGSGYTVIEAARAGHAAIGCDLSLEALVAARGFAEREGVADRTFWVCCSAEQLPLASASCGSILAVAVMEHVPDDHAALREAARVVPPGGRMWVTVPHALRNVSRPLLIPSQLHDRRLGHLRRYEAEELVSMGSSVGLKATGVQFTGHPVKVLQLVGAKILPGASADRVWWWCEEGDLRRSGRRRAACSSASSSSVLNDRQRKQLAGRAPLRLRPPHRGGRSSRAARLNGLRLFAVLARHHDARLDGHRSNLRRLGCAVNSLVVLEVGARERLSHLREHASHAYRRHSAGTSNGLNIQWLAFLGVTAIVTHAGALGYREGIADVPNASWGMATRSWRGSAMVPPSGE